MFIVSFSDYISSKLTITPMSVLLRSIPRLRPGRFDLLSTRCIWVRYGSSGVGAMENPAILRTGDTTIYLLGTMHISNASAAAARALINREHSSGKLGCVFLELDDERVKRLSASPDISADSILESFWKSRSRGRESGGAMFEAAMKFMYGALHKLGFGSGVEFRAALETVSHLNPKPKLVLGDQHITTTLKRIGNALKMDFKPMRIMQLFMEPPDSSENSKLQVKFQKILKALYGGDKSKAVELIETMVDRNTARELSNSIRLFAPTIAHALIDERDAVMAQKLYEVAISDDMQGRSIVAIVGLAHVDGIVERWDAIAW